MSAGGTSTAINSTLAAKIPSTVSRELVTNFRLGEFAKEVLMPCNSALKASCGKSR